MKFFLFVSTFILSVSGFAETIDLKNQVTSLDCKAYYGGDNVDHFFIQKGPSNPGDPNQELEFIHSYSDFLMNRRVVYPVLAFNFDTSSQIYTLSLKTIQGQGSASFTQQGSGFFTAPGEQPYPLDYCEIQGDWQ